MKKINAVISIFATLFVLSFAAFGQTKVAPLPIVERTLANGLRVVSVRDNTSPTVAIHVWYNVGSKDDPQGRSNI